MFIWVQLIYNFILFLFLSLIVLYLPGFGIMVKQKKLIQDAEMLVFSFSLSFMFFVAGALLLAFFNLRWLMLPVFTIIGLLVLIKYRIGAVRPFTILMRDKLLLVLILLGIIIQGLINFPSGFLYKEGLLFWSSQGHDGIWHISLMEEIKRNLPPASPIFAGEQLYNYHYLVDVLMGEFGRIFPVFSSLDLYFRFFPVIFSLLIGLSVFAFVSRWQGNEKIGYLGLFFTYFTGSFGYIVTFLRDGNIFGGETVFWASQENTLIGNPPHAIAHVFFVAFLLSFLLYLKERKIFWLILGFILGSMLAGFKVSGGLVLLTGIGAAALVDLILNKKKSTSLLALALAISNFATFKWMTSKEAVSFLMFLPWWFIRTMIVARLGWMDHELRRQHYLAQGTWNANIRVLQLETTAFLIFIIGNFGMRMIGMYAFLKSFTTQTFRKPVDIMLLVSLLTGILMVMLFVQKGIIYNNIQYIQYSLLILGFYAASSTYYLLKFFKKKHWKVIVLTAIILLSVPTVIGNLNEFYGPGRTPLAIISNQDLEALRYLKDHTDPQAIILTMPFNKYLKDKFSTQPRPIYAWYNTAYIPALTGRKTYLTDEEQAMITGYKIDGRLLQMTSFFGQQDFSANKQFLKDSGIGYIYLAKKEIEKPLDIKNNNLSVFFENSEVVIYRVENSQI